MTTEHKIFNSDSAKCEEPKDNSVDLVITSPPYPMIQMWDDSFSKQDINIEKALKNEDGDGAFELMHRKLDNVWEKVYEVLKPGGIACINIGDATRTISGDFKLYSNHARIISKFLDLGFSNLPNIIWRKQTNAPNKFMGSGMLPPGAYVTLEHEYILNFRKGGKREFKSPKEKEKRHSSSYFWEERNEWFSDIWTFKGTKQSLNNGVRERSGAYPIELAYRLINMFSVKGETVFDPFLGLGTTTFAAMMSARNSIGIELEKGLYNTILDSNLVVWKKTMNDNIEERLKKHLEFVNKRKAEKGENAFKYQNEFYNFPVMTKQELKIVINFIEDLKHSNQGFIADYNDKAKF